MDKIKSLMVKNGLSDTAAGQVCEALDAYKDTIREQLETEYAAKVAEAKKICLEETEAHKRELARRVTIFLEAKSAAVEAKVAESTALRESEAITKLQEISTLLGSSGVIGAVNGRSQATISKLQRQLTELAESKNQLAAQVARHSALAERVLKQNRKLAAENAAIKATGRPLHEGAPARRPAQSQAQQATRIDTGRRAGQATTTRPTLSESQDRRPVQPRRDSNVTTAPGGGYDIANIAESMDEDLI